MDDDDWALFLDWYKSRPPKIRDAIYKYPPWQTYRMRETYQIGTLYAYEEYEDGTVKCKFDTVSDSFAQVPVRVFGVSLDSLEAIEPARTAH